MPFLALLTNLTFYHLCLLTFILGAQIYQSFFANITASNALTRAQFRILQAAIWPMYFKLQMVVSILLVLTYPGGGHGKAALLFHGSASVPGLFDGGHRLTVLLPLSMMFVFSAANVLFVAPRTISAMWRLHLESVREEKARGDTASSPSPSADDDDDKNGFAPPRDRNPIQHDTSTAKSPSPNLQALTSRFLSYHGASYLCNMATVAASVGYGVGVALRGL